MLAQQSLMNGPYSYFSASIYNSHDEVLLRFSIHWPNYGIQYIRLIRFVAIAEQLAM